MLAELTFGKIQRKKLMRWCECLTEKQAVGMRTSEGAARHDLSRSLLLSGNGAFVFSCFRTTAIATQQQRTNEWDAHSKSNRLLIMITVIRAFVRCRLNYKKKKPMTQGWQYFLRCRVLWLGEVTFFFSLLEMNYKFVIIRILN